MNRLPNELILFILSFVSLEELTGARLICGRICRLIDQNDCLYKRFSEGLSQQRGTYKEITQRVVVLKKIKNTLHLSKSIASINEDSSLRSRHNKNVSIIPKEIGALKHLTKVFISFTRVGEIPKEIALLRNLERLHLENNEIEEIPTELFELTNLKDLRLHRNKIKFIPEEIGNLVNLEVLILTKNPFNCLPRSFEKLTKLRSVLVDGNLTSRSYSYHPLLDFLEGLA